jgi:hypothetical protein
MAGYHLKIQGLKKKIDQILSPPAKGIFARGHLAKVKSQSKRKELQMLAKTSLKDLIK